MNKNEIIYVVRSFDINLRKIKLLDYIMDNHQNIICWQYKDYAEDYIVKYNLTNKMCAYGTTISNIEFELEQKKNELKNVKIGIRIIEGIEYD